ncbi:unnamed protein product [Paramecium primaurelia]|uniref:Transmembrane protein n=1 Tax=Paramecium primaurelia TaxID=5886 RepID=A0A8S1NWK8_PARPR|nr:unnamed protein product [Paramecium primaurelia]
MQNNQEPLFNNVKNLRMFQNQKHEFILNLQVIKKNKRIKILKSKIYHIKSKIIWINIQYLNIINLFIRIFKYYNQQQYFERII